MNRQDFESIVETYGADARNWPEAQRASITQLLAADPQARSILGREAALDAWLTTLEPPVSETLEARIQNDMLAAGDAPVHALNAPAPAMRPLRDIAGSFAVALAACLMIGVIMAPDILNSFFAGDEMVLALDLVGNEFLN